MGTAVYPNQLNISGLDFSDINESTIVRHIFDAPDVSESASRLSSILETIQEQEEERVRRLTTLFELFNQQRGLKKILSRSAELRARYQVVDRIVKQRHRNHEKLAAQNYELTRQQVGDDWFALYLRPYPMSMVGFWSHVRKLLNIAARGNIEVNVIWRTAHAIALQRLNRGGRGISTVRYITRADVQRTEEWFKKNHEKYSQGLTIEDNELVPDTYLDADNQIWFDEPPPSAALDERTLPRPTLQSQDRLQRIREKRKAEQAVEGQRKETARLQSRAAATTPSHQSESSNTAHIQGGSPPETDENTGTEATDRSEDRRYPTSVPSIYQWTREWQPTSPQIVPVIPLTEPCLSQWIPDFANLSQLQRDLIDVALSQIRWSTNPDIGLVNPRSFNSVRTATSDEISDAILQLRKLVCYEAPQRPEPGRTRSQAPINPYTAEENGRYFWMLSVCQYLSALDLGRDLWCVSDWLSLIHRDLVQLRRVFPITSFPRVPVGDDPSITLDQSSLSLNQWQGGASDDLVFNMMQAYTTQYGYDRRIQVISPAVYRRFTESLDDPTTGIFVAPVIADDTSIVLIPVHRENYWTLGIIDKREDQIAIYHINSAGQAFDEPYIRHLLNLNGFDTTYAQLALPPGPVPQGTQTTDAGFWVMAHARQFLRNERLAPVMETGKLRLSLLQDLWHSIQGRNPSRKSSWRPSTEEYASGLRDNALRTVQAIQREADCGDTRIQTINPHQYFRPKAQHTDLYGKGGYTLGSDWFGDVFELASTFSFDDTTSQEGFCLLPHDKTLQSWQNLSDFAHRRATQAAQNKARLREIEDKEGLGTDQYSGSEWQSLQESARRQVQDARKRLERVQDDPNKSPTPLSIPPLIRGAESIIDSESSRGPASSPPL